MERSVALACAQAHPAGCRDEPIPEAEALDRPRWDEVQSERSEWDASDGVRLDAAVDAVRLHPALPAGVDAGKSADLVRDVPVLASSFLQALPERWAPTLLDAVEELYKPGADLSAEQSFVAQAFAVQLLRAELPTLVERARVRAERRMP